jgi:hypothetical protein
MKTKKLLSLVLAAAMLFSIIPANAFSSSSGLEKPLVEGYISDNNGYIKYFVDISTGGFYILPSDQPFDGTKVPSFGSFKLGGKEYVFGGDYKNSGFTLPPFINDGGTCQAEWRIGDIYITQFLNIVQNDAGIDSYAVYIRYEASTLSAFDAACTDGCTHNHKSENINFSFEGRILLDTMFGPNDDMPVTVSNNSYFISS